MPVQRAIKKGKKQSPMLLRRESGACNEYFIGLSLIGCQFSIAGLRGPIFNHFCNARAICSVRRGLSGPFLLSTTYRQNMLEMFTLLPVSQNNAQPTYCNRMTRLAFSIQNKRISASSFSLNLPLQGVTGWQGGHVSKLHNHKEVKKKKKNLQASYIGYIKLNNHHYH